MPPGIAVFRYKGLDVGLFKKAQKNYSSPIFEELTRAHRYYPLRAIGEGAIAKVSGMFDSRLNRVVALKELRESSLESDDLIRSFITEIRLTSFLDHPGVLPVFDAFTDDNGRPCYTMKLFEGKSLASLLAGNLPEYYQCVAAVTNTLEIFMKICETLAFVHDRGVLHLDLKPENIMVGRYGEVAIMDWSNAFRFDSQQYRRRLEQFGVVPEQAELAPERDGIIFGTPKYMSPEQSMEPRRNLTPASDIFSTGIILYEFLTGTHPFPAMDVEGLLGQIRFGSVVPVHGSNGNVPRQLSSICMKMLEKSPERRYQCFHQILDDLIDLKNAGNAFLIQAFQPGEGIFSEGDTSDYASSCRGRYPF